MGNDSQRKGFSLRKRPAGMTSQSEQVNTLVGVNGGLVSNDSDSEIREASAQGAELDSFVRIFSWSESHVVKHNVIVSLATES